MADPLNEGVIEILRRLSGCQINVFISSYREIRKAIGKYYDITLCDYDMDRFKDDRILGESLKQDIVKCFEGYNGEEG